MTLAEIQEYQEFKNLELLARHVVEGFITGLHKSPYHGFSVEFAEHRLYNSGESTRFIDWKIFARTEKLFVKKFEEETNLRCNILIDTSSSMYFPVDSTFNKLQYSVYMAAALINLLSRQRDATGLTFFDNEIKLKTEEKVNAAHLRYLYLKLQELLDKDAEKGKVTFVPETLHQISEMLHKRSLVVIFSDMFDFRNKDDIFEALQHLRHNKHEVILFHVFDGKKELEFDYDNRPYRFVDLETGKELKINAADVRDYYKKQASEFFKELEMKAGQYKIDFVKADINEDFRQILVKFLLKRQKMF